MDLSQSTLHGHMDFWLESERPHRASSRSAITGRAQRRRRAVARHADHRRLNECRSLARQHRHYRLCERDLTHRADHCVVLLQVQALGFVPAALHSSRSPLVVYTTIANWSTTRISCPVSGSKRVSARKSPTIRPTMRWPRGVRWSGESTGMGGDSAVRQSVAVAQVRDSAASSFRCFQVPSEVIRCDRPQTRFLARSRGARRVAIESRRSGT